MAFARTLSNELVGRYRAGEPAVLAGAVNIDEVSRQHPQRSSPGIEAARWKHEPFIIGDLLALEPRFARFLSIPSIPSIWTCAAELLDCAPRDLLFHFCNLTRKPGGIEPAVGWHRDADNRYFASHDARTLRLLVPLQLMSARNGGTAVVRAPTYPGRHHDRDRILSRCVAWRWPGAALWHVARWLTQP